MPKYSRKNNVSEETKEEALKVARGTQRPGQTKEQTKLISLGIQKGIDLYKKQHKAKARELDKKLRQVSAAQLSNKLPAQQPELVKSNKTAWYLLVISWLGFAAYIMLSKLF